MNCRQQILQTIRQNCTRTFDNNGSVAEALQMVNDLVQAVEGPGSHVNCKTFNYTESIEEIQSKADQSHDNQQNTLPMGN